VKRLIVVIACVCTAPAAVRAADADNSVQGQYYLFIGPTLTNTQYNNNGTTSHGGNNTGIGGEVLMYKGVGMGIDLGYAGNWEYSKYGSALGVGSWDASYHFLGNRNTKRIEPFLEGGYSLYYGQRTFTRSACNFGGGFNLWLTKHVAPRFEIRYQGGINYFGSQYKEYAAFRFGVTFR